MAGGNSMIHISRSRVIVNISIRSTPTTHAYADKPVRPTGALCEFRAHLTARCAEPVVAIYSRITLLCYRVECHQLICIISAADVIIASLIRYGAADGSSTAANARSFMYTLARIMPRVHPACLLPTPRASLCILSSPSLSLSIYLCPPTQ